MRSTATPPQHPSRSPRSFGGHPLRTDGDLLALAFGPDGSLWSVEEPGVLRRWSVATRTQESWEALDEMATLWAFQPDGELLAAISDEVGIWNVPEGEQVIGWSLPSWCTALAFQPKDRQARQAPWGPLVATGHDDGSVFLWDRTTGRQRASLGKHGRPVSALAFSPDGEHLASAGEDKIIHLWNVADGTHAGTLSGHTDRIPALAWHPDGQRLFSAGWNTAVWVWAVRSLEPLILLNTHATQVFALSLSADGKILASADSANAVHLWDTNEYRTTTVLREPGEEVRCLAFSSDGQGLAWGGADRVIHLWDSKQGLTAPSPLDPKLSRTQVAVSPDGRRLLSLGAATCLRVWEIATGEEGLALENNPTLHAFAASPDGQWIAASRPVKDSPDGRSTLGLWSAQTGRPQAVFQGQAGPLTALAFSPDSATLASGGFQNPDVWLWKAASADPLLIVPNAAGQYPVEALAFHSNGRLLAVCGSDWLRGEDGWVCVWDLAERRAVCNFRIGATAVAFQPGGPLLAVATQKCGLRFYDVEKGKFVVEVPGHLDRIASLAFSPDGKWLASGGDDRYVRLWEPGGEPAGALELDTQVKALAFAPTGETLFTGNGNTSCYLLTVDEIRAAF